MREAAKDFFSGLDEEWGRRPRLDDLQFKNLCDASRQLLEVEFTEIEVLDSLNMCNGDKAPGLDGFNMKFLQDFWHVIKSEMMDIFREFRESNKFVKSLNTAFLVLIAKKKGAKDIKDFRPISLVGCMYKLIAKVLANRLFRVLGEIIGDCQHAWWVEDRFWMLS